MALELERGDWCRYYGDEPHEFLADGELVLYLGGAVNDPAPCVLLADNATARLRRPHRLEPAREFTRVTLPEWIVPRLATAEGMTLPKVPP